MSTFLTAYPGLFSFTYLLYVCEYYSNVGASVLACVFPLLATLQKKR